MNVCGLIVKSSCKLLPYGMYIVHVYEIFRLGKCGSWSFNMNTKICYLHESDACCNQLSKREVANEYMSGYNCPVCWSTKNDCPCSEDIRLNNFFKRFTSGGKMTENLSAAVRNYYYIICVLLKKVFN